MSMPIKFIALLLIFNLLLLPIAYAEMDDDDDVAVIAEIELDSAIQQKMGLETRRVHSASVPVYRLTYGKVLDLTPLLKFRRDCLIGRTKQQQAQKQFNLSGKALKRLEKMFKNKATSLRKLEQQRRVWLADQAQLRLTQVELAALLAETRLRWGRLADVFCQPNLVARLLSGEEKILTITKPIEEIATNIKQLELNINQQKQTVTVQPMATGDLFDPATQSTYRLYKTTASPLHPGQHFSVELPLAQQINTGLFIPQQSMLWHLGQAFIYIKTDQNHFQHRNIDHAIPVHKGYLVKDALEAGEEIVTRGAQQLLSTEFRSQIVDDDDD